MKLSIIIPVYNVAEYLEKCVTSIVEQIRTRNDTELILVDDGSRDRSPQMCDNYSELYKNVKTIHQKNAGSGRARNTGIESARGTYLYFVDPDDYLTINTVAEILKMLEKRTALCIFGYWDVDYVTNKKGKKAFSTSRVLSKASFRKSFASLFKTEMLYTVWNKVYSRQFLIENKLFFGNASMGQDVRFNLAVYEKVESVYLSSECLYYYVQDRNGSSTSRYRENSLQLKSEELFMLQALLNKFGLDEPALIALLHRNIFLDVSRHIIACGLPRRDKIKELRKICASQAFTELGKAKFKPSISWLLLYKGQYNFLILYVKARLYLQSKLDGLLYSIDSKSM
ncbi:glycosyltransferase family 2 protein [Liquorilactobacillus satsumensis]|uniref:Glycosyltransferase n=1 Tax=Liquorilactobacillus satsumensis DSM 16230 = JCM 12392 TaxID=1423801 RepID=A0A0R1UZR8_9LACO|nr:glycosyltransferase [Liquorilactobacillus satsumensis]KRL98686.1 glycosyltransferase [Liquorilactobacillus satsumensis DSM 16230 = JCM 12392]MCP9328133.1 glycosyltransferase [Liquorilactobacillus satsumensis]